jgi:hypothetical protein
MTSAIRRLNNPPPLPRAVKREQFPPIQFQVLYGRIVEAFEAKVPVTHGAGYTIRGYGRSWVTTTVRDELSVWLVDHQTGQQHKIDFGADFLPMRVGNDISLLWANGQLVTIVNHTTRQLKHPCPRQPVLPEKKVGSGLAPVLLFPLLLVFGGFASFCSVALVTSFVAPELIHHQQEISRPELIITAVLTALFTLLPTIGLIHRNARNARFNGRQQAHVATMVAEAEVRWIKPYQPPLGF